MLLSGPLLRVKKLCGYLLFSMFTVNVEVIRKNRATLRHEVRVSADALVNSSRPKPIRVNLKSV